MADVQVPCLEMHNWGCKIKDTAKITVIDFSHVTGIDAKQISETDKNSIVNIYTTRWTFNIKLCPEEVERLITSFEDYANYRFCFHY